MRRLKLRLPDFLGKGNCVLRARRDLPSRLTRLRRHFWLFCSEDKSLPVGDTMDVEELVAVLLLVFVTSLLFLYGISGSC